uniref:O-phosphoseryl-tRNA(Sec) selenium transferase n=3 Tax=Triatominae TaxID=70999 RepID=T1HM80_RHOPR
MFKYLKEELGKIAAKHGERILDTRNNPISMAMTLSSLNSGGDNKRVTLLGSMLFLRYVSGTRCITGTEHKDVASYHFEGWGAHHSTSPCPYLTAAAGLGMKKSDVDLFVHRLDKALGKVKGRSAPGTPTSVEELAGSRRRVLNGETATDQPSSASTSLTSSKDSLRK